MSTKIYHGFRFRTRSLWRVHDSMMSLRPVVRDAQRDCEADWLASSVADIIDREALGVSRKSRVGSPLSAARSELWDRQSEMKKSGRRDPQVDFEMTVSVLPFRKRVYGLLYAESRKLRKLFEDQDGIEDFAYWDSTDPPDDVDPREWGRRGSVWSEILAQDWIGRPSGCGFAVEFATEAEMPKPAILIDRLPDIEKRARRLAVERVADRALAQRAKEFAGTEEEFRRHYVDHALKAISYANSDEASEAVESAAAEIANILPCIDEEMLTREP